LGAANFRSALLVLIMATATKDQELQTTPTTTPKLTAREDKRIRDERLGRYAQTVALLLMAMATLGSSWCSYQAGLWSGIQTFKLADSTKMSRLASEGRMIAGQQRNLDEALFVEYARAVGENNETLAKFFRGRLRPEFQPAVTAWLSTHPLRNKTAPSSPFEMPEYHSKANELAQENQMSANTLHDEAQKANRTGDTYTLLTVLFTTSLFSAGLITGFHTVAKQWLTAALSFVFILLAGSILMTLPVAHVG
jgi:hypothetical protein